MENRGTWREACCSVTEGTKKLTNVGPFPDFRYEMPATNNLGPVTPFEEGILNSHLRQDKVRYHDWLMLYREIFTLYCDNQKIEMPRKVRIFLMLLQVLHIVTTGFHTLKKDCTMQVVG